MSVEKDLYLHIFLCIGKIHRGAHKITWPYWLGWWRGCWRGDNEVACDMSADVAQSSRDTWSHRLMTRGTTRTIHVAPFDLDKWHHNITTCGATWSRHVALSDLDTWHNMIVTHDIIQLWHVSQPDYDTWRYRLWHMAPPDYDASQFFKLLFFIYKYLNYLYV